MRERIAPDPRAEPTVYEAISKRITSDLYHWEIRERTVAQRNSTRVRVIEIYFFYIEPVTVGSIGMREKVDQNVGWPSRSGFRF